MGKLINIVLNNYDYNTNSGGKYAEYFTPHAVSRLWQSALCQRVKMVKRRT